MGATMSRDVTGCPSSLLTCTSDGRRNGGAGIIDSPATEKVTLEQLSSSMSMSSSSSSGQQHYYQGDKKKQPIDVIAPKKPAQKKADKNSTKTSKGGGGYNNTTVAESAMGMGVRIGSRIISSLAPLPPNRINLNELHPSSPPYLGESYWVPEERTHPFDPTPMIGGSMSPPPPPPLVSPESSLLELAADGECGTTIQTISTTQQKQQAQPGEQIPINITTSSSSLTPYMIIPGNGLETTPTRQLSSDEQSIPSACSTLQTDDNGSSSDGIMNTMGGFYLHDLRTTIGDGTNGGEHVAVTFTPRRLFAESGGALRGEMIGMGGGDGNRVGGDEKEDEHDGEGEHDVDHSPTSPSRDTLNSGSDRAMAIASRRCTYAQLPQMCSTGTTKSILLPGLRRESLGSDDGSLPTQASFVIHNGVVVKGTVQTPPVSVKTSNSPTHRRQIRINTLPSFQRGRPVRLRVTEAYTTPSSKSTATNKHNNLSSSIEDPNVSGFFPEEDDYNNLFSYDPYFSAGQYHISTPNGSPYGNGLSVKMGGQNMTLQDRTGEVLAVMRSRYTFVPSHVIYSVRRRFEGQRPSSHRVPQQQQTQGGGLHQQQRGTLHSSLRHYNDQNEGIELYPWALVKKSGRRMDHDVTIHFVQDTSKEGRGGGGKGGGGTFCDKPAFRSKHGFDGFDLHTHTVVSRVVQQENEHEDEEEEEDSCCRRLSSGGSLLDGTTTTTTTAGITSSSTSTAAAPKRPQRRSTTTEQAQPQKGEETIPCCLIIRDPFNHDVFNVTIAPGIDPLLILCYLACHAKMDIEPKLST